MVDVSSAIEILCPIDKVSQFANDLDNTTKWYVNIKSVEWKTAKPLAIGSEVAFVAHFLGKKISYTYKVVELSTNKLAMRTSEGPFPMETNYSFKKLSESKTEMTLRNFGSPSGFSKLFTPFMKIMMKRANVKDLKKLKSILEKK